MAHRRVYFLLPILVLALAGCYRQASDPVEPASETRLNTPAAPTIDSAADPTADDADALIIIPDFTPEQPADGEDDSPASPFELQLVESTPIDSAADPVAQPPADSDDDTAPELEPLPTEAAQPTVLQLQLVTPGGPTGPSAVSTPTPTDLPEVLLEPLITPTDRFNLPRDDTPLDPACVHVVRPGDTLFRIALNNQTTVDALRAANPQLRGDIIQPGDELALPNCAPSEGPPAAGPPPVDAGVTAPIDTEPGSAAAEPGAPVTHVVQRGETLAIIANRYGVTINAIAQANNISNPNLLSVGQELIIPTP